MMINDEFKRFPRIYFFIDDKFKACKANDLWLVLTFKKISTLFTATSQELQKGRAAIYCLSLLLLLRLCHSRSLGSQKRVSAASVPKCRFIASPHTNKQPLTLTPTNHL